MTIIEFAEEFFYSGTTFELAKLGAPEPDDETLGTVYIGSIDNMPEIYNEMKVNYILRPYFEGDFRIESEDVTDDTPVYDPYEY